MTKRRRLTAWILAGLVLFAALACVFEIAREAHHVCIGGDCRICAHMTAMRALLRVVSMAVAGMIAAAVGKRLRRSAVPFAVHWVFGRSPVCLKVKLLN